MRISLFCFALFLSHVLSDRPINVQVAEHHQCIIDVSESAVKHFIKFLEYGKRVIFFRIHYDSKQADALTQSKPDDHFANPNEYMWLYDGEEGLAVYMNAPYDFEVHSLFLLKEYTSTLTVNMNVSKSCNERIVSRVHFLRLVFRQLIQIVYSAPLPDKKASAYFCYDINNRKSIPESTFMANKRVGINRQIILRYCCKVKDYHANYNESIDLCRGKKISIAKVTNLHTFVGAFLFSCLPLVVGFISMAKLNPPPETYIVVRNSEDKEDWLHEHDPYYSVPIFVRWLLLFEKSSLFVSRIRRSLAVISCLIIIFSDFTLENFTIKEKLRSYLGNNVPLGYRAMMFGYEKSAENTDYFFGGPFVWFTAFVILGLIVINIPDRLCETIAKSTDQRKTCTFLVQDIKLLEKYGNLNKSNLQDYELLHAILKSSVLTALNPSFWFAVIEKWFSRLKRVSGNFNKPRVSYQLIGVCVTFLFAFICFFLCVCELLLCIVYYGCPLLQTIKAIPHSYTQCYICPLFIRSNFKRKALGVMCLVIYFPIFIFLVIFSMYVFVITINLVSSYTIYIMIALIAKPDAIAIVLLLLVFVYYLVRIAQSISKTYLSLQKVSITLAETECDEFVLTRYNDRFIHRALFKEIVRGHHPVRYEIAKALIKLALGAYILASCAYAFQNISMNMSVYIKIGLLIFTTMIPKLMSVLKDTMVESRWKASPILKTIRLFKQNNSQFVNGI